MDTTHPFRIATWNIAAGHRTQSLTRWDYGDEELRYFIEQLSRVKPDILCVQEAEFTDTTSQVTDIAQALDMPHYFDFKMHISHITPGAFLGGGIISRFPIENPKAHALPYPDFPLIFKDGHEAAVHEKYLLTATTNGLMVASIHLHPIHIWKYSYDEEPGASLGKKTEQLVLDTLHRPVVLMGDLYLHHPEETFKRVIEKFQFSDGVPEGVVTRPSSQGSSRKSDHIFVSPEFQVVNSGIVPTETDHYLCWADIATRS